MSSWFDAPIILKEPNKKKKKNFFFEFLQDISYHKENILTEDNQSQYAPYMVNRFLSMDVSTLMYAQEMNSRPSLDKDLHYEYLINSIRKRKRFFKYIKADTDANVKLLAEYYNYSNAKAKEVLPLHSSKRLIEIATKMNTGGTNAKKRTKNPWVK